MEVMNIGENFDTFKIDDDQPKLLFGPEVDGKLQEGVISLFRNS